MCSSGRDLEEVLIVEGEGNTEVRTNNSRRHRVKRAAAADDNENDTEDDTDLEDYGLPEEDDPMKVSLI